MVDQLVRHVFIEERAAASAVPSSVTDRVGRFEEGNLVARYLQLNTLAKPLLFVAVHARMMAMSHVDGLMHEWAAAFTPLAKGIVADLLLVDTTAGLDNATSAAKGKDVGPALTAEKRESFAARLEAWVPAFTNMVRRHERGASFSNSGAHLLTVPDSADASVSGESDADVSAPEPKTLSAEELREAKVAKLRAKMAASGPAKRGKKSNGSPAPSGAASPRPEKQDKIGKKKKGKEMRKWDTDGRSVSVDQNESDLDFSANPATGAAASAAASAALVDKTSMGHTDVNGMYEVADFEVKGSDKEGPGAGWTSKLTTGGEKGSGFFSRWGSGSGTLTKEDLAPALQAMQQQLQSKNVAADVAARLCSGAEARLVGRPRSSWWSTDGGAEKMVRSALSDSIARVLTPRTSTDVLAEISARRAAQEAKAAVESRTAKGTAQHRPYTIAFVGVNGVGKSTNLSKVAFWLLQNQLRVLVAACDTFRAGAVEQLRVHVRNLSQLHDSSADRVNSVTNADGAEASEGKDIALFEAGYGRDAAALAGQAIVAGEKGGYDVVLIDTAGRMQDNEPLMRALARLVQVNRPDKILFVGEALTGNEAVDQLSRFDGALKDLGGRGLDGMILTKFDTSALLISFDLHRLTDISSCRRQSTTRSVPH